MISKRSLELEQETLQSLKYLMEVYQEVAATRMQRVRGAVLQSRLFMEGLLAVFARVKASYLKKAKVVKRASNNQTVAVFVSANSGLYGDIVERTFGKFSDFVRTNKSDVVVLGKLGVQLMAGRLPEVLYNYFDMTDDGVDPASFDLLMRYLIQYDKIQVFHGQFRGLLSQEVVGTSVSGDEMGGEAGTRLVIDYLFEPSVESIAKVFEGEILSGAVEQSLHEAQLAKHASRMLSLDQSIERIEQGEERVDREKQHWMHGLRNKKQLQQFAGVNLWG